MPLSKDDLIQTIFGAIDEVNCSLPEEEQLEKLPNTILAGDQGTLDSLGLINFIVELEGRIKKDYKIIGSIFDFDAKILKKFNVSETNLKFELYNNNYSFYVISGNINQIDLTSSEFNIVKENKDLNVKGSLVSKANLKNIQNTLHLFKINLLLFFVVQC